MTRPSNAAPVLEVFASIQGEGAHVGEPQVLVRLAGCPLRCRWCDTPHSWRLPQVPDWCTPGEVARRVAAVEQGQRRTISITGGEPLLWPDFVAALGAALGGALDRARRIQLETAGAHPAALERVIDRVDHVSLDLKLPADLGAPVWDQAYPEPHPRSADDWAGVRRRTLALVAGRDACAKLVVAGGRAPADFAPLLDDLAQFAPRLPVFVQPVTAMSGVAAPSAEVLGALVSECFERGLDVRVVPQIHPVLGVR